MIAYLLVTIFIKLRTHTLVGHDKQYVCSSIGVQTYSSRELSQSGAWGSNDLLVGYVDINFSSLWVMRNLRHHNAILVLICVSDDERGTLSRCYHARTLYLGASWRCIWCSFIVLEIRRVVSLGRCTSRVRWSVLITCRTKWNWFSGLEWYYVLYSSAPCTLGHLSLIERIFVTARGRHARAPSLFCFGLGCWLYLMSRAGQNGASSTGRDWKSFSVFGEWLDWSFR